MNRNIFDKITVPEWKFCKAKQDRQYISISEVKTIDGKKVIVTFIWKNSNLILINVLDKYEYISKNILTGKTTTRGTLSKLITGSKVWNGSVYYDVACNSRNYDKLLLLLDKNIIKINCLSNDKNDFEIIEKYINKLNSLLNENKLRSENEYFNKFKKPKFPKGFTEYCKKWIAENDRLFISKNKRNGEYKGYCSHCGCKFSILNYNYVGQTLKCPSCWEDINFYFDHKNDTKIMFAANVGYFEKIKGKVAVRLFHIYRRERGVRYDDLSEKDFKEYARYVITDKKIYYWQCENRYGMGSHWYECGWFSTGFKIFDNYFALFNNLESLAMKTPLLKYQNIIERSVHTDTEIFKVIPALKKYPCIEYLQAQGWKNIVSDIFAGNTLGTLNAKGTNASEVFGIDVNKVLKFGKEINIMKLFIFKLAERLKLKINADVLAFFDIYYDKKRQVKHVENLFQYVKPIKFVNYATAQKIGLGDYMDYLDQLKTLNYDIESEVNLYPRDFKRVHVELSALITAQQKKIFETAIETIYSNFHNLCEWTKDGLSVIMAKNCEEIVKEGIQQNHCVGNYCERVAKGESIILFLRRVEQPEQGFYTMEIRPDMRKLNLIQCRGYRNQDPSPEARAEVDAFLVKYEKWFNRRSAEGFNKNNVFCKYYKAVRKTDDGRYFSGWDGKTEFKIGEICETELNTNPDEVAVKGLHIASLEFAQNYGDAWKDVAILEVEVNINDVIVPDAKDQIRTSRFKVLREVPMSEMGEWGEKHMAKSKKRNAA